MWLQNFVIREKFSAENLDLQSDVRIMKNIKFIEI